MKNRIKNFYKDLNDLPEMGDILDSQKNKSEPYKKNPEVTEGEWVSVLIFSDPGEGEVIGVHVVQGKSAFSNVIMQRIEEGIYDPMELETFNVRIETEETDNG